MLCFGVLGPLTVTDAGHPVALPGPRHRAVLARLIAARGEAVAMPTLIDDLWDVPPPNAAGAVQTFVGALRKALEPGRPPRTASRLLLTVGSGYALVTDRIDATRFAGALASPDGRPSAEVVQCLDDALALWRGPAYADFSDAGWARAEAERLEGLRDLARELRAAAALACGEAATLVADLEAQVARRPHREEGWRLLALALYRSGRQADALAALRRCAAILRTELGLVPSPSTRELEADILGHAARLATAVPQLAGAGAGRRLDALAGVVAALSVTGDLAGARRMRIAAIAAAESYEDPILTAGVVSGPAVPANWTTSDEPAHAEAVAAAAERALAALSPGHDAARARLLATIALERRAEPFGRGGAAAREAETLARAAGDPELLSLALNGRFLQEYGSAGLAEQRGRIGAELVAIAHDRPELATFAVLGHLILIGASAARADLRAADQHARAAEALGDRHELPVVAVFSAWYRGLRLSITGQRAAAAIAYRAAAGDLVSAGMPGLESGLLGLALLSVGAAADDEDFGPYAPWARPAGTPPDSPQDLLLEARLCLAADHAIAVDHRVEARRLRTLLEPAAGELAGAGSGLVSFGPVQRYIDRLDRFLDP